MMIAEGVLEQPRPAWIIGQHVHPPLAAGKIGMRAGLYMASSDELPLPSPYFELSTPSSGAHTLQFVQSTFSPIFQPYFKRICSLY
ncbi:MAG: hypothetical protein R2795_21135 [Saprospiraceae bacterium]